MITNIYDVIYYFIADGAVEKLPTKQMRQAYDKLADNYVETYQICQRHWQNYHGPFIAC